MTADPKSQVDKFAELARALECDEDEARWEDRLKAVAKHRHAPDKSDQADAE